MQLANKALDEVRRDYWNQLRQLGDKDAAKRFKDARWALLKNPKNLTDKQAATYRKLRNAGGEVWLAYTLKEALRACSSCGGWRVIGPQVRRTRASAASAVWNP